MAVSEYDRLDQLQEGVDGRLILAMIEPRPYGGPDEAILNEDFRMKINTYIQAVRSGYAHSLAEQHNVDDRGGFELALYCRTKPSETVLRMIEYINRGLSSEGISASWESIASKDVGLDGIERALVVESFRIIGSDWKSALMWATLVGNDGSAGVQVERNDGSVDNIAPSDALLALLSEHKHVSIDNGHGPWLSGQIFIESLDNFRSRFSNVDIPPWMPQPTVSSVREEIDTYMRDRDIPELIRRVMGQGSSGN